VNRHEADRSTSLIGTEHMKQLPLLFLLTVLGWQPASAQWSNSRTPGIPRAPDGRPDLTAAAPRTVDGNVDFTGVWIRDEQAFRVVSGERNRDLLTAWAKGVLDERQQNQSRDIPTSKCLPSGIPPDMMRVGAPFKIVQTRNEMVILLEEFNNWREIFADGRRLPDDPEPAWFGYSVGKWEGDTFVVESAGFNDKTWLDSGGTPHSKGLHMIERFRRPDVGHMQIDYTFDDPEAFVKSVSAMAKFKLMADSELIEHQCENEKDAVHIR
jgi:hypothetical protein